MSLQDEVKISRQSGGESNGYRIRDMGLDVKAANGWIAKRKAKAWVRQTFGVLLTDIEIDVQGVDEDKQATFSDLFPTTGARRVYRVDVKFATSV